MTKYFPTYAKSAHPDVLEAIRATHKSFDEFTARCRAASEKFTGDRFATYYRGSMFDRISFTGFNAAKIKAAGAPGKWTKPEAGVTRPYSNNPVWDELKDLNHKAAPIPGRGNLLWGGGYMGTGTLFEYDGVIYSKVGFEVSLNDADAAAANEYGWTEILASEFHLAVEAENARRAATTEASQ